MSQFEIGDTLADALLHAYESWRIDRGLGPSPVPSQKQGDDDDSASIISGEDPIPGRPAPARSGRPAIDSLAD